jgi:hypothetical protein
MTDAGRSCSDSTVKLVVGGTASGNNRQNSDGWSTARSWHPTTDANDVIGGSGDTWGLSLTAAQINAGNFGVALSARDIGTYEPPDCTTATKTASPNAAPPNCTPAVHLSCSLNVDSVSMTVYYSGVPAATPTFAPGPGGYGHAQSVTISDATPGATIYYTTDGTTPTTGSPQYSGPISVGTNMTINAIATATGFVQSAVATGTYVINGPAATPTFSPVPGAYPGSQSVMISDTTPGAVIHYTNDGTTPTAASPTYSMAISVAQNTTIKAIASAAGYDDSTMATGAYTIAAATPTFSPAAGTYSSSQSVTLSDTTTGAVIHYTIDGSTPTAASPTYSTAISVTQNTTIRAIAIAPNYDNSAVATAVYVISAATPTFSPAAGAYPSAQNVTISDTTTGAVIHYTTDGSTPTAASPTYSTAISVTQNTTIKAIAISTSYGNSSVGSAAYTIAAATPTFSPAPGAYASAQNVTLSDTTTGAVIHYTTDNTTPTASSATYTSAISVTQNTTIKAIAIATNYDNSAVATGNYVINGPAATPTFSPAPGSYGPPQNVTISSVTSGATLYYSTDGADPAPNAPNTTQYQGAITVDTGITLKAIATAPAYLTSAVATGQYIIGAPQLTSLSTTSGSYNKQVTLTGSYFGGGGAGSIVYFGTTSAPIINWGNQSITVSVPKIPAATYAVTVVVNGQSSNGLNFTVTDPLNISPSSISLYVGQVQTLHILNPDGSVASGVTLTSDNPAIASAGQNQSGQPQVQAAGLGTVTVHATDGTRDGQMTVNVYSATATAPPDGTILWSVDPLGSNSIEDYFRAAKTDGAPAFYSIERNFNGGVHPDTIRTFNSDASPVATHVLSGTNETVSYRLALPDGGVLLRTAWLFVGSPFQQYWVKMDGQGNEKWRFPLQNNVYSYSPFWAVNSDGLLFTGRANGSANTYEVVVFDTNTGTMKYNIPVPMGVAGNSPSPSLISVPTIFPDGNAYYPMVTRNDTVTAMGGSQALYSFSESLNLLSVSPTGQSQTIHLVDNSCSYLQTATNSPIYFNCYAMNPNEVVPTNEGGKIVTWSEFRGGSFCDPTTCPTTTNNHFVTMPQGGTPADHVLASVGTSDSPVGTVTVGENGVFYQALPAAVVAADYNTGQQLWNYDASATGEPSLKLSAVTDTGANEVLVMEQQAHAAFPAYYSLFTLDAAGNKTYFPWLSPNGGSGDLFASLLSPEIADNDSYYGIVGSTNQIVKVGGSVPADAASPWLEEGGTRTKSRNVAPEFTSITPSRGLVGTTVHIVIAGRNLDLVSSVRDQGTGIIVQNPQISKKKIQADFVIDPHAPGGNHVIELVPSVGNAPATFNFYVQIPTHLVRTTVDGAPGGIGPLHVVNGGGVFDITGTTVKNAGPLCGVYQWFAYSVDDQQQPPQPIVNGQVTLKEAFSNFSPLGQEPDAGSATVDLSSTTTNRLTDIIGYFPYGPVCPNSDEHWIFDQTWTATTINGVTVSYPLQTTIHITAGNFSGTPNITSTITIQ